MTPEFAAYKDELRAVAWQLRLGGLVAIMVGCGLLIAARYASMPELTTFGFVFLGLGWGVTGYAVWVRTQWAKQHPFTGPR